MAWTELLSEPLQVTSLYSGAPSLQGLALMELSLHAGCAKLVGDLRALPDPLPPRWVGRGYGRAGCTISALDLVESRIEGAPSVGFDDDNCMLGQPVDVVVAAEGGEWTAPGGSRRPLILLRGEGVGLSFRFVCRSLDMRIRGYEPAPY